MEDRAAAVEQYRAYLEACNRQAWDEVGRFVADSALVNGSERSRAQYLADLQTLVEVFPDYRWELRQVVVEGHRLAAHLRTSGTRSAPFSGAPGDGSHVKTDEFAVYHFQDGLIRQVDGTADNTRLQT